MTQSNKKTSSIFTDWFYLTLLLSSTLRQPLLRNLNNNYNYNNNHFTSLSSAGSYSTNNNLHYSTSFRDDYLNNFNNNNNDNDNNGPLSVDNFYYNDNYFLQNNLLNNEHYYHHTKTSILLRETQNIFDDLNSLGRYSSIIYNSNNNGVDDYYDNHDDNDDGIGNELTPHHNSNLIAFPIESNVFIKQEECDDNDDIFVNGDNQQQHQQPIDQPLSIDFDLINELEFEYQNSNRIWPNLNDDPLIQGDYSLTTVDDQLLLQNQQIKSENDDEKSNAENNYQKQQKDQQPQSSYEIDINDVIIDNETFNEFLLINNDNNNDTSDKCVENIKDENNNINENGNGNNNDDEIVDEILPLLGSGDNGDVNDLFDELEALLSNETDGTYGQNEWSLTYNNDNNHSYQTLSTVADGNGPEYPIYNNAQNYNVYEPDRQFFHANNNENCTGEYYCNTNTNADNVNQNFGTVLYSSITTLSNSQDAGHQDHLLSHNNIHHNNQTNNCLINDVNNPGCLSNIAFTTSNSSLSDCFYSGYVDEYNIANNYSTNEILNQSNHSLPNYDYNSTISSVIPSSNLPGPTTSTPIPQHSLTTNNNKQQPKFSNTEDCFDKSSDSAVSSMSSDRVHSLSDNDLVDTSSESSYNCEINNNSNNANNQNNNSAAKKKYRLFGKNSISSNNSSSTLNTHDDCSNKIDDSKTIVQLNDYYGEYPPINYLYANSTSYSMIDTNNVEQYHNYYLTTPTTPVNVVQHNHTYAQIPDNESLNHHHHSSLITSETNLSCSSTNDAWIKQENDENSQNGNLITTNKQVKTKSNRSNKIRTESTNSEKEHNHFNRDEKRARALNIPISTDDIINLPIDEFNERLTKYDLSEIQLSLIRDIRRRGKNKVAAQNCRKRKLDQIMGLQSEVDNMYSQKDSLENQYSQLLMIRELARDKYNKLYHFVVEASSSRQTFLELSSSPPDFPIKDSQTNEIQINDNSTNGFIVTNNNNNNSATATSTTATIAATTVPITSTSQISISSFGEFDDQQK